MKTLLLIFSFFIALSTQCMELPEISIQKTKNLTIEHATALWQNYTHKSYQEDKITCTKLQNGCFFGVYDGHSSRRSNNNVSSFLRDNLHILFEKSEKETIKEKLEDAFESAEKHVLKNYEDGSTAIVAYIDEKQMLHLAWAGDSRAVLEKNQKIDCATQDHDPLTYQTEKNRIIAHGLLIKDGYIRVAYKNKELLINMSRSIGDKNHKEVTPQNPHGSGAIIATPEYHAIQLNPDNHFLIIASDGIWLDVSSDYAIQLTNALYTNHPLSNLLLAEARQTPSDSFTQSPQCDASLVSAAQILGAQAIKKGSQDNIAVIIAQLKWKETENNK